MTKDGKLSLAEEFPEIAKEWDYKENDLKPNEIIAGTAEKYFWKCSKGHSFYTSPDKRITRGANCSICNESMGEQEVYKILKTKNIEFKTEYRFKDCKDKIYLPFDFAIFKGDVLFSLIELLKNFKNTRNHDNIKTTYCEENNISLLRIKYNQINIIDEILSDFINNTNKYIDNHFYNILWENYYIEI